MTSMLEPALTEECTPLPHENGRLSGTVETNAPSAPQSGLSTDKKSVLSPRPLRRSARTLKASCSYSTNHGIRQ